MTGTLRLVDTGTASARWNIAATAALAELHAEGRIPHTLRLHRYPVSALLGVPILPVTTLAAHLDPDPAAVAAALATAIADALGLSFAPSDLTQEERARADALLTEETLEALP